MSSASRVNVGLRSERGPILIAVMLSTGLVAIDSTVIATAVPSVVRDLGGFAQFPWLFSIYLLAQAVAVPIYGKLADLFGRKPIMFVGIGLFFLGSALCGVAWSMPALIAFRAIQGLGAGAVQPMALTIVGDVWSLEERGTIQGYIASVWGVSAVVGPTIGGVFSEYVSWRWIFFVNIPLCLIAAALMRRFHERVQRRDHVLDIAGAGLLTVGCTLLILGLLEGGHAWPWRSVPGIGVIAVGVALLVAFVLVERRAAEPVVPLWVFRRRVLVTCNLVAAGVGAALLGLTSYVPTFVQGVLGAGPLVAGFTLGMLSIGWPITASQSGRAYLRIGFRNTALIGSGAVLLGASLMTLVGQGSSLALVGGAAFGVGAGFGWVAAPSLIAAQSTVEWAERGVVTGANMFSRSIGSAVGVAVFGAIANASLAVGDDRAPAVLARASHHVFLAVLVAAVLMAVAVTAIPRRVAGIQEAPQSVPTAEPAEA
jgi:MFS family permease